MLHLWLTCSLAAAPSSVALLSTTPSSGPEAVTALRFQRIGGPLAPPVASLSHVPGTVRGALMADGKTVAVTAQHTNTRDVSFAFALYALEAKRAPKRLVEGVAAANAPIVTGKSRVVVSRGVAGPPVEGGFRVDALTLDEVDVSTGEVTTLLRWEGYVLYPAVVARNELIVYRVGPNGGRVDAVHLATHAVRPLATVEPLAHDFATDGAAVYFTLGDSVARTWSVKRIDLKTGELSTVAQGPSVALLPTVLADGRVVFAPEQGAGLVTLNTKTLAVAPHGEGFERVVWSNATTAVIQHEVPGSAPRVIALELSSGVGSPLPLAEGTWSEVAGVLP